MHQADCENINPYHADGGKTSQMRTMFNNIAPAYDFMNRAMTFGIDRLWRRKAVKLVASLHPRRVLDVATGTADMAILMARKCSAGITGIDLSQGMINVGLEKVNKAGLASRINLQVGDCLDLPFDSNTFQCITVAYGVRNFEHLLQGYESMFRVLEPGGTLVVLELSIPTSAVVKPFYKLYTRGIIPLVGRLISHDSRAYSYLPESIAAVPQGTAMTSLMEEAGFENATARQLTLGVCTLYTAVKPLSSKA
mgnify:FL=1